MFNFCMKTTESDANTPLNDINNELSATFSEKLEFDDPDFQSIGGYVFQKNLVILEGDALFNIVRKQWMQAEEAVLAETCTRHSDVSNIRKQIVDVLYLCRYSIQQCEKGAQRTFLQNKLLGYLKLLKNTITPWTSLEERLLLKLTSSAVKDEKLPVCHYFHMYLEVQWLLLSLHCLCEAPLDVFDELLKNLVVLSKTIYKKHDQRNVSEVDAFVCACVKHLWVLLQLFNEKLYKKGLMNMCFWEKFNCVFNESECTFSLWLLQHVAMLQGYTEDGEFVGPINSRVSENYSLIDSKLKSFNTNCPSITNNNNQMLLNCCKLIDPLLDQWWTQTVKSEPYQILWEVFNKHINLSFGTDMVKKSAAELVELSGCISTNSNTNNSYEYFLYMLSKHLSKFPNQWPRIKGRIYSKLPPHKMNELSDAGLVNIALLFLSLANSVNVTEMSEKLGSLLSGLKQERRNSPLVLNIHMSLVILHALRGFSIKQPTVPLLDFVQEAAERREMFHLVRAYIDGFDSILNASQSFGLHQHVLIGSWVVKYMTFCPYNDLCYFLNVLLCNVKRIRNAGASLEWEQVLKQHVLCGLKQIATSPSAPSQIGELAALIDNNPSSDTVLVFTADTIAPKIICTFLSTLLEHVEENYVMSKNQETAVLHAWIRCCLLNCENSEKLTRNVVKISALSSVVDGRISVATNPLCYFIKALGNLPVGKTSQELCEQCFGRIDCWVTPHVTLPSSEAIAVHIYTCIGLLFFHCASLLYHKSKSNCLLNRLVSAFLLPQEILMGKLPHPHVLSAVNRTWHVFVQGIWNAFDCSSDAYIERTLRDMVVRYVPVLPINDSPILKCLGKEKLISFILEKVSAAFLSHSAKNTDGNATKALKVIHSILESSASTETTILVLKSTLTAIFEVIMFHTHKNMAIDIIKYISLSDKYDEQLRLCIKVSLTSVTEKHLAFNANSYFQFINTLVKIIPADIRLFVPTIRKQVVEVERMRGVGYDNTLRQGIDRLESLINH